MKKIYTQIFYIFLSVVLLSSCKNESKQKEFTIQKVKIKSKKKDPNSVHKKGIEEIADYQKEIRKPVKAEKSSYKKGYLITEYNKSKRDLLLKKSVSSISPVFIERGPNNVPGRARGIAVDPTNSNRWFVGTVGGGVWLTENGGSTWQSLTDFQIPNLATSTIVISPTDPNTLYVGTGEPFRNLDAIGGSGVFKTTDGGTTWQHLTATKDFGGVGRIIMNPNDKNNVLIGTTSGIYRTTDGGTNWSKTYSSSGTVQDLDADPSNFNIQYGSVNNLGIVKSIDGGVTWAIVFNKASFNTNHSRFETSVSPADPNTVFLSVYSSSGATVGVNTDFYVSRNKGTSFTSLKTTGTAASANLVTGQGWYDNVIMAHPYDSNIFYVGGVAVFKVTVSGSNFTFRSIASGYDSNQINSSVHVDQHGLFTILGSNQEFRILLANDGGVYSTSLKQDSGATDGDWSNAVVGKNSTQFYGASKQNGQDNYVAGAQDNGSWVSQGNNSTANKTYTSVLGGDGFETIWHYNQPGNFIVTSQYNTIGRYVNFSGALANTPDSGDNTKSPFISKLANANNNPEVVFTISTSGVWRSTDFAGTWKLTPITDSYTTSYPTPLTVKVSPADPDIVWAGSRMSENGSYTMQVSQDNGQSFTKTTVFDSPTGYHDYYISGMSTSYTDKNRAYVLFSGQGAAKILKTEDLGNTWTDISGFTTGANTGFPDVAVHSILEMPFNKDLIWAGTDIGIFQTENGGASWSLVPNFLSVAVYDMKVVNDQVVIATHGRGIWSATISELNSYTPAKYLALSTVNTNQKEIGSLKAVVNYDVSSNDVNRVKIFVDNVEQTEVVQNFSTGVTYTYETGDLTEGVHTVGIQLFDDTNSAKTPINNKEFTVINFKTPSPVIKITEFKNSDIYVNNSSFKIDNVDNKLTSSVLNNSEHPYGVSTTYSVVLKQPLTLSPTSNYFIYEDVALVEPYTDDLNDLSKFFDFVLIEGSTDLKTWKTIDKYDSRKYQDWLTEYNKGASATVNDNLFKSQLVSLSSKGFSNGETIVFRFSLVSDPAANSFGWAIKSINKNATASVDDVVKGNKAFTMYPTISNGEFTIFAKNTLGKSNLLLFDINGKQVFSKQVDFTQQEKQSISVNLTSGVYIVHLIDVNNKKATGKVIIK